MKKTAQVLFLAALAFGAFAHADEKGGLYVEPLLTYEQSNSSVNWPSPLSDSSGSVNGFGLGARLGFHINEMIFVAGDARYSKPTFKDSSTNYSSSATAYNWGATAGVQMPDVGVRVWGSYVFGGNLDPEASGNFDVKMNDGKGYRVGAGIHVQSFSINLEYQELKYNSMTIEKAGPFSPNTTLDDAKLTNKSYILSVGFPITI